MIAQKASTRLSDAQLLKLLHSFAGGIVEVRVHCRQMTLGFHTYGVPESLSLQTSLKLDPVAHHQHENNNT
jgi:hypothetical protein